MSSCLSCFVEIDSLRTLSNYFRNFQWEIINKLTYLLKLITGECTQRVNYIRIYLHEFTNNEQEISIPHEAAECGIENFEFIVSEWVLLNPKNSRAMSVLTFLLFKLNKLQTEIVKLWVSRSHGVMTVVYWIYTTGITPW